MGKRGYQGESPADRSINLMDKFIKRSEKKQALEEKKPPRRKDKNIPMELWPLKDQIEYWDNLTEEDWFDRKWSCYGDWLEKILELSNQYHRTFKDSTAPHKERILELFNKKIKPKESLRILQKEGIVWL